jgi:hypothetical protein
MSLPTDCCSPCVAPVPAQVPGPEGPNGLNGTNGLNGGNAYTVTTAGFTVPAVVAAVTVAVASTAWMATGQIVFIPGAGNFSVTTIFGANSVSLTYSTDPQNTHVGAVIGAGTAVTPSAVNGAIGTNGSNGFTTTTANFVVPAIDTTVIVSVASNAFMFVGQYVNVVGGGTFKVTNVNVDGVHVTLAYPNFVGNSNAGNTINSGALVSSSAQGVVAPVNFYGAGANYVLTATPANLAQGGNPTQITLNEAGTWMIFARTRYDFVATTLANARVITTKLRRTNNTAGDIANSSTAFALQAIGASTYTITIVPTPPVIYTTANANDVIELWGSLDALTGVTNPPGALETEIFAIWLHP